MLSPYRALLALPGTRAFVVAGLIGRFPLSMLGLGAVLLITGGGGSYGLAGAVSAVMAVATAAAAPLVGRLIDQYGQRRVIIPSLALHVLGVTLLIVVAGTSLPTPLLFLAAVLVGMSVPQIGSMVRSRWTALVGGTPALNTAFSLESVLDEVVFVIGPVAATALAAAVWGPGALVTATVLAAIGSLLLAAQRSTEPLPHRHDVTGPAAAAIRSAGLRVVTATFIAVGAIFGSIEVAMVAFAQEQGSRVLAGPLLAAFAGGSLIAGLLYGIREWRRPLHERFLLALAALGAATVALALAPSAPVMAMVVAFAGLSVAPSLVAGMSLVEALVPARALTEGFAWVTTAIGVGVAIGSSLAGKVIDVASGHRAFLVAVVAALLALLAAGGGRRRLRVPARVEAGIPGAVSDLPGTMGS